MYVGDFLSYVAPLIPAATSILNEWKGWRKKHKEILNVFFIASAVAVAWTLLFYGNQQQRREASEMQNNISGAGPNSFRFESPEPNPHYSESRPAK
jgi:hypothetical protein